MSVPPKFCFVIGPIGARDSRERKHADTLLRSIIRPVFRTHFRDFRVERADHMSRPGMIDSQIITALIDADLVIADLTTKNANAFYELGIRHVVQRPVIHMFKRGERLPMDVAPFRAVEFSYKNAFEIRDAKVLLRKTISEAIRSDHIVENPVTRSAGFSRLHITYHAPSPIPVERPSTRSQEADITKEEIQPVHNAPGLHFRKRRDGTYAAYWRARHDAAKGGFKPSFFALWRGTTLTQADRDMISGTCTALQGEMLNWMKDRPPPQLLE